MPRGPDIKPAPEPQNFIKPEPKEPERKEKPVNTILTRKTGFGEEKTVGSPVLEGSITVLGKDISFNGELRGSGSVKIDGTFKGTIILDKELTILRNGHVEADIEADTVTVDGKLIGNITARNKVIITDEGRLTGDIKTAKIAVDEGAVVKGRIDIIKADTKPPVEEKKPTPPPANPPAADKPDFQQGKQQQPPQQKPFLNLKPPSNGPN
ncbi:polymer-forming cytoskeletal protein [bacterium]|nr:polymer-forming cytoskeletal protein [candidate division CSSED10-310 bacterium]